METRTPPTTLTGDACRRLERIIRDDLEHALIHDRIALEGLCLRNLRHQGLPPSGDLGNRVPGGRGIRPSHLLV